jgi:predicted transcriptional regulator
MSTVLDEMQELMHYGMPRRSGRYPWGSGDDPYQHNRDLLGRIEELKKQGWTETPENIMKEFNMTTTQYRTEKALAKSERRKLDVARAKSLRDDGLGATEIGREMGLNESTVRSLLNDKSEARMNQAKQTADFLREQIKEKGMIDVGAGVERELNISKEKLNQALHILEEEGYPVYGGRVDQVTNPGKKTTLKVICPPGTEHKEIYNFDQIHTIDDYVSRDGGETFSKFVYPKSMDSSRLKVRYAEEGGIEKDGIIEIRRGVEDLSLGNTHYAQVRILVDDTKYLKGMAVYSDDMPDGVDVVFNTNKKSDVPKMEVLKNIKEDPDNPFGALIKAGGQSEYTDANGNKQLSLINKTREEGDWDDWKDKLPSQFLSKQALPMAKKQLGLAIADKEAEYDEICSLTNPTVKKHLLQSFADDCDKAAVNLQAAALPGQKYHVIIPVNSLKDTEVYAPGYGDGTKLALIRYPHGGTFEIPVLTVNNKNATAKKLIGTDAIDAVCINSKVAERLSGADFDGDTVMCIPTHDKHGRVKITSTDPLKGLEGFDPKTSYSYDKVETDADGNKHYYRNGQEFQIMKNTGTQMGIVSNLITDMTIQGASTDKIARAVRHSMVVIDAEKHKLDYKQSEIDNGIASLKKEFQSGGASTIISRAKGQQSVDKRQGTPRINQKGKEWYDPTRPEGALIYKTADDLEYTVTKRDARTGKTTTVTRVRKQQSTKMAETDDAYSLVSESDTPMERAYADYANKMKAMANQARMEMVNTGKIAYSASAKAAYQTEVDSLMSKLNTSLLNAPRERRAQLLANAEVKAKRDADPDMSKKDIKKASQMALTKYRDSVSAKRQPITITDKEWDAIQAGAISENTLSKILKNTDVDNLRQRATPRATTTLSPAKINKIKSMRNSNYSLDAIAKALGVSTSTVSSYLKGVN